VASDDESLDLARRLLTAAFHIEFTPVPEGSTPTADLVSVDGAHLAEVKRITSSSLRELRDATRDGKRTSRDVADLTRRWLVILNASINSDTLPPMPKFPEPSAYGSTLLEAVVLTRAEREAEFRETYPGPPTPTVFVRGMIDELIPLFKVLEANDVSGDSYAWHHWFKVDKVSTTQRAILARTGGARVSSFAPKTVQPGVNVVLGWGGVRTEHPDTIAGRIQTWLDSHLAKNLRDSLRSADPGVHQHAILVFDADSEPEYELAATDASFVPEASLNLPPEVDTVWAVFGERGLAYRSDAGWSAHPIPRAVEPS